MLSKPKFGILAVVLCFGLTGLSAQEVQKQCTITGSWVAAKSKGKISWKVKLKWNNGENNAGYGFSMQHLGPQKDQFGDFTLGGSCSEGFCDFQQSYAAGKFKGRTYTYHAGYDSLHPLKLKGNYERLEGENKISEGKFSLDKMTCSK